jgi:hypothetical protein
MIIIESAKVKSHVFRQICICLLNTTLCIPATIFENDINVSYRTIIYQFSDKYPSLVL